MKLTVNDVLPAAQAYIVVNPTGGPLHIVLDDNNIKNSHIEFCREKATEANDQDGIALCDLLLQLSTTQRLKITYKCWSTQ